MNIFNIYHGYNKHAMNNSSLWAQNLFKSDDIFVNKHEIVNQVKFVLLYNFLCQ